MATLGKTTITDLNVLNNIKENNKIISEYFITALSVFYVNKELNISYFEDAFTQDAEKLEISLTKKKMLKALKILNFKKIAR